MSVARPKFKYHEYSTVGTFRNFILTLNSDTSQTLLIYPSKPIHHGKATTLYSRKFSKRKGAGRVRLTDVASDLNIPTLGLPIHGIPVVKSKDQIPQAVQEAIEDLWRAAGFGLNLVLPVRQKTSDKYFARGLHDLPSHIPEFWWFRSKEQANLILAEYYLEQLQLLKQYLEAPMGKTPKVPAQLLAAYAEGQKARKTEPKPAWYSKDPRTQASYKRTRPSLEMPVLEAADHSRDSASEVKEATQVFVKPPSPQSPTVTRTTAVQTERPSYEPLYKAQEDARWWKTALAITVGILTLPTIIIPVACYFLWKYAKENELVQKFEMTPNQYAALKEFRRQLGAPKLDKEKIEKPQKDVVQKNRRDPDQPATYYTDREQGKRLRFFMERMEDAIEEPLNEKEMAFLRTSKEESVKLAPQLGY